MNIRNRITDLFNIKYPIIQGGMVWVSGWKLAKAVSENGGLGLIGAGSMKPELLDEHIQKIKSSCKKSFGVNLPLLRGDVEDLIQVLVDNKIENIFTSAGHPGKYFDKFKNYGAKVVHVVSNPKQAIKAESVGCDAIVAEGVEAGGHNGLDEITTFTLIPAILKSIKIPIIAAGGIGNGNGILAALSLGAEGVQIGTLFASAKESSAHINYKNSIRNADVTNTKLILKNLMMARVIDNKFSADSLKLEKECETKERIQQFVGQKREKLGIFDGDLENGMLEAGQISGIIQKEESVSEIFSRLISEYDLRLSEIRDSI